MTTDEPRPRPAPTDIVGSLAYIMDRLDVITSEREERRVSATAAAKLLGYSDGYCKGRPWRIPFFGAKGYRHSVAVWRAWLDRPDVDRHSEWDRIGVAERRKIRGVA
jgi:hypothetical protein